MQHANDLMFSLSNWWIFHTKVESSVKIWYEAAIMYIMYIAPENFT